MSPRVLSVKSADSKTVNATDLEAFEEYYPERVRLHGIRPVFLLSFQPNPPVTVSPSPSSVFLKFPPLLQLFLLKIWWIESVIQSFR